MMASSSESLYSYLDREVLMGRTESVTVYDDDWHASQIKCLFFYLLYSQGVIVDAMPVHLSLLKILLKSNASIHSL